MSEEALYERYKGALRNGHVAAVRGRNEDAIAAYAEAAALAPDRPLPHTSMGRTLLKLGRVDEALAAFAAALRLAPRDEAGLAGRADALIAALQAAGADRGPTERRRGAPCCKGAVVARISNPSRRSQRPVRRT